MPLALSPYGVRAPGRFPIPARSAIRSGSQHPRRPATMSHAASPPIPFDTDQLDSLMDEAGMDVLLATSKHNTRYLLGGHQALFFEHFDAVGVSRYMPIIVYPKGAP